MSFTGRGGAPEAGRSRVGTSRVGPALAIACLFVASCTEAAVPRDPAAPESIAVAADRPQDSSDDAAVHDAATVFLQQHSNAAASAFVESVAVDGDRRWAPWLVDVLRLGRSNLLDQRIGEVLEQLSGIPSGARVPNLVAYGGWVQSAGLDGGDGYPDFKVGSYELIDPRFGELLRSVESQHDLAAIQFGGVPLGGIPELNSPKRISAANATWMTPDEAVLGVDLGGEAVAYPLRILRNHELVNDVVGGLPISVVYCTLCRSALVFDGRVGDQTLTFLTSGLLLNSNKIMYDNETGSLWQHLTGTAIGGPLLGTELDLLAIEHVRWNDWVSAYPDTAIIDLPDPIFFENPERPPLAYDYTPDAAYKSYYESDQLWFPVLDAPDDFGAKTEVVGIEHDGKAIAIELAAITAPFDITVGNETFHVEPTGPGVRVTDLGGDLVVVEQSFWFAWYGNHPDTEILILGS